MNKVELKWKKQKRKGGERGFLYTYKNSLFPADERYWTDVCGEKLCKSFSVMFILQITLTWRVCPGFAMLISDRLWRMSSIACSLSFVECASVPVTSSIPCSIPVSWWAVNNSSILRIWCTLQETSYTTMINMFKHRKIDHRNVVLHRFDLLDDDMCFRH